MSLNVNPLSPDKWFCNIYEVCVLGWIQTKSKAVMKPCRAVQSLCSSRFPTERHNRNQSVCDIELCSLLLLHFGRRQMKCSVFVSTNTAFRDKEHNAVYSRPCKGGVLEHNILWETACNHRPECKPNKSTKTYKKRVFWHSGVIKKT